MRYVCQVAIKTGKNCYNYQTIYKTDNRERIYELWNVLIKRGRSAFVVDTTKNID